MTIKKIFFSIEIFYLLNFSGYTEKINTREKLSGGNKKETKMGICLYLLF